MTELTQLTDVQAGCSAKQMLQNCYVNQMSWCDDFKRPADIMRDNCYWFC